MKPLKTIYSYHMKGNVMPSMDFVVCECDEISNGETCVKCGPSPEHSVVDGKILLTAEYLKSLGDDPEVKKAVFIPKVAPANAPKEVASMPQAIVMLCGRIETAVAKLRDMIDGGEECRGRDSEISDVIRMLEGSGV